MPTPMKTIPGTSFHDADRRTNATTPQMIQTTAVRSKNPGRAGRRPTWGSGAAPGCGFGEPPPPLGVYRPPFFLPPATTGTLGGARAR